MVRAQRFSQGPRAARVGNKAVPALLVLKGFIELRGSGAGKALWEIIWELV